MILMPNGTSWISRAFVPKATLRITHFFLPRNLSFFSSFLWRTEVTLIKLLSSLLLSWHLHSVFLRSDTSANWLTGDFVWEESDSHCVWTQISFLLFFYPSQHKDAFFFASWWKEDMRMWWVFFKKKCKFMQGLRFCSFFPGPRLFLLSSEISYSWVKPLGKKRWQKCIINELEVQTHIQQAPAPLPRLSRPPNLIN